MGRAERLITEHLDLWSSAIKAKPSAGRGSSKKLELYGISKLRVLILDLAVRGLLTPQEQTDDSAQHLLENITNNKQALISSKVCRKPANLPPISEEEKAFHLPSGWEWARLQDICEYIQRGKGPSYSNSGSVRVISQKCVQWKGFDPDAARYIEDSSLAKYKIERFLKPNDLLWNSTGTGTVGRINRINKIMEGSFVADSHVTVVRTLLEDSSYICIYLASAGIQKRFDPEYKSPIVSGSTNQVELNTKDILTLPIPIPPHAEQHRIVAKVDELMALCDQLEEEQENNLETHETLVSTLLNALTSAAAAADASQFAEAWQRIQENFDILFTSESSIDQLKQTILQLAVMGKLVPQDPEDKSSSVVLSSGARLPDGHVRRRKILKRTANPEKLYSPPNLPQSWEFVEIQKLYDLNLIIDYADGNHGSLYPRKADFGSTGVTFVTAKDIKEGKILWESCSKLNEKQALQLSKGWAEGGDVLLTHNATVGRVALVETNAGKFLLGTSVTYYRLNVEFISPSFIYFVFCSPIWQHQLQAVMRQTTRNQVSIQKQAFFQIPLPPLNEQHRIVAKVDELMVLCDQLKANLELAQKTQLNLADSLVEQAVQSPA